MNQPDCLLFIAPGCPHCPGVLELLARFVKEGTIGVLEVVNVAVRPERAQELGIRGVPWVRLGPFELEGALTAAELRHWVEQAGSAEGLRNYMEKALAEGGLTRVERLLARAPEHLSELIPLVERADLPMQVRIGISALLEQFAGTPSLRALVPELGRLAAHANHRVRSDACHFLGLTGSAEARPILESRLSDENAEVRDIAQEALGEVARAAIRP